MVNRLLKEKYAISVYLRSTKEESASSKFPVCKQMIFFTPDFVVIAFLYFFRYLYLIMEIISSIS